MPPEIHAYLIDMQANIRKGTGVFKSIERIIYDIIRKEIDLNKK